MKPTSIRRVLLCSCLLGLVLCGCTDVKQINRITFVTAMGIEKADVGVRVHAVLAIANRFSALSPGSAGNSNKSPNYILTEEGSDISEALFKMKRKNARDIQFGHDKIMLFSEELAKEGLNKHLDLFMRRSEFQPIAWIALTHGSPRSILETNPQIPDSPADLFIDVFSQAGTESAEILPVFLYEFYSMSVEPGQTPYAMFVKSMDEGNHFDIASLGLFHGDQLVGTLTPEETMYLQLLQNRTLHNSLIQLPDATLMALRYDTKIKVNDRSLSVELQLDADVDENHGEKLEEPSDLTHMEQRSNEAIESRFTKLIRKMQQLHVDPAGIGNRYRKQLSGKLLDADEWTDRIFPGLDVNVTVRTKIVRRGTIE